MTIETKFSIGDKVFVYKDSNDDKVDLEGTIVSMTVEVNTEDCIYVEYDVAIPNKYGSLDFIWTYEDEEYIQY